MLSAECRGVLLALNHRIVSPIPLPPDTADLNPLLLVYHTHYTSFLVPVPLCLTVSSTDDVLYAAPW